MKLNLGSCNRQFADYLSVDLVPPADVIADLSKPWPWADDSVDAVKAFQVAEHIADSIHFMNELWRVCKIGTLIEIEVPNAAHGAGAFQDPTHKSFWTLNSFLYFQAGKPHRERFGKAYGIKAKFVVMELRERASRDVGMPDEAWIISAKLMPVKP